MSAKKTAPKRFQTYKVVTLYEYSTKRYFKLYPRLYLRDLYDFYKEIRTLETRVGSICGIIEMVLKEVRGL